MANVEDITEYLRTLRRGYDRNHFSDRVKELAGLVDVALLAPDDFNTLFRIWLALEIPITAWSSIGLCLIPVEPVQDELIRYTARWLLAGLYSDMSPSRLGFLLNWLTAALDHNMVNANVMDECYIIFQTFFQYDRCSSFVAKLLYTLTKPHDVTRYWTQSLLDLLRTRDTPRGRAQISVLLSLYKSYKPECVPENIPAVSVHSAFPKINTTLLNRFRRVQNHRNTVDTSTHLSWRNNLRAMGKFGRPKGAPLIPDMEFIQLGSQLYSGSAGKTLLHFNDGEAALAHTLRRRTARPAQLLSLLCNDTGAVLLCMLPADQHSFFSHDLKHQLDFCFLQEERQYKYEEKADLLHRLGHFQQLILQAVPVVSNFLIKYLMFWNGCDYFEEIMRLCEWVQLETWAELHAGVLAPLALLHCTLPPVTRCALRRSLTTLYDNLAYSRTRQHNFFLSGLPERDLGGMLSGLSSFLQDLCAQSLRTRPDNATVVASCLWTHEELGRAELAHGAPRCSVSPAPLAGLALATRSLHALNCFARVLLLELKVVTRRKKAGEGGLKSEEALLVRYKVDVSSCLWRGRALAERAGGLLMARLTQDAVDDLLERFPEAERCLEVGRHAALAPLTYARPAAAAAPAVSCADWLRAALEPRLPDLAVLLGRL